MDILIIHFMEMNKKINEKLFLLYLKKFIQIFKFYFIYKNLLTLENLKLFKICF